MQQVLIVAGLVQAFDSHRGAGDGSGVVGADEFGQEVVAVLDRVLAAVHRVAGGAGDEVAGGVETAVAGAEAAVFFGIGAGGAEVAAGDAQVGEVGEFGAVGGGGEAEQKLRDEVCERAA